MFTNPSEYSLNLNDMEYEILQTCEACLQTLLQANLPDSLCSVRTFHMDAGTLLDSPNLTLKLHTF